MSIVFSEKTRRTRLQLRWPFSRQLTLSVGTLLVLLAVWWAVAAQQWVSPLFLPPPGQVLAKLITIAGPQGFMDATLWQHLGASWRVFWWRCWRRYYRDSGGDRDGAEPDGARHPRPAD
jgi:taurine transport system permease protein